MRLMIFTKVYEVKFKHGGEVPLIRHVAKFQEGYFPKVARVFNHSNLYYFGDDGGFIIDTETWSKCSSIPPTPASNSLETIVYAYDKVYYLARRSSLEPVTEPSFGRYDPNQKVWEQMTPFSFYDDYDHHMRITGYAVCHGVILFSLCGLRNGNFSIVAFNVGRMDWSRVKVDNSACCDPPFQGRAVVVGKTIYALYGEAEIIAFSFKMEKGGDDDIAYSLSQLFILQCLEFARPQMPWFDDLTQYLVYLGNHDFFYVQTGWCDSHLKVQYLSITTFQIVVGEGGGHMIKIIHSTVHSVDIKGSEWFDLVLCFTPECEDYEHIEEESMASMNQPRQEITAMKLEIEAMQHEEANDARIGY
ncbi:uncharacterized protein LOC110751110 isoform X2 [Prunus avium]|uniref:Uncharacterized protein LOC110751110 isoform X2 n=1 Tax=Prunus avium TaxID=42229 RepID=A0A6P5RZT7_PRUAV|nr:uncharacterized protein LOC110751110 isoform X2 [Prunus avium]